MYLFGKSYVGCTYWVVWNPAHTRNNKLPTHAYVATAPKDLCIWIGKMISQWCSCHPISKAGRAFRVTGCRPNVRIRGSRGCERNSRACERNGIRLGVREMVPRSAKFRPKGSRNMPPTRTAYRLGFVSARRCGEVDFNCNPNRWSFSYISRFRRKLPSKRRRRRCGAQDLTRSPIVSLRSPS